MESRRCAPFSLISACVMLVCATILQALQGYPDALSVSFLLIGVTSVIHHCRLDTWWKRDVWKVLDYLMIVCFSIIASVHFANTIWVVTCFLIALVTVAIWTNVFPDMHIPAVQIRINGLTHLCVIHTSKDIQRNHKNIETQKRTEH